MLEVRGSGEESKEPGEGADDVAYESDLGYPELGSEVNVTEDD